jgi:hypothetical protein
LKWKKKIFPIPSNDLSRIEKTGNEKDQQQFHLVKLESLREKNGGKT